MFVNLLHVIMDNFEKVYQTYKPVVYSVCYRILKNEHDAKDAMQDAFIKLSKNMHLLKNKNMEQAWVITAARCASIDFIKKENKVPDDVDLGIVEPYVAGQNSDPEDIVIGKEAVNRIYEAIQTLDPKYAILLIYKLYFDLKAPEIASLLNLNINTTNTRLRRGFELLRSALYDCADREKEARA